MAFNYSVSFSDPNAAADPQDAAVRQAMNAALSAWSQYVSGVGTLIVQLNLVPLGAPDPTGLTELAEAGSTNPYAQFSNANGLALEGNSAVYELTTGKHAAASDITVYFNSQLLPTLATDQSYDLTTVFEHELMHGFGVSGFRNAAGRLPGVESKFDALSALAGGQDYFTGAAASYVYGGAVPLTTGLSAGSNYYHVGASGTPDDPAALRDDLIYPISQPGQAITALDVGILEDVGVPVTAAGQVLIDPNPSSTIHELAGDGTASVVDPSVGGFTQPYEVVTLVSGGATLGAVQAGANGSWSLRPAGLADGNYDLVAEIAGAGGVEAVAQQFVALNTASPLHLAYYQVLGRDATAAELALGHQQLTAGTPLASLRAYLARTGYAAAALNSVFLGAVNRPVSAGELPGDEAILAAGGSLTSVLGYLASSSEAANALGAMTQAVVGRAITAPELTSERSALTQYFSLSGLRYLLATSAEAAGKLQTAYADVLGRAASSGELSGDETAIGTGAISLAGLRGYLATTNEAATKLQATYQSGLGRAATVAELSAAEQSLGAGTSLAGLRAALAVSPGAVGAIDGVYQSELARAPSGTELSAAEQSVAGSSLQSLQAALINGTEFASDIGAAFETAFGRPANAVEIAAAQSEAAAQPNMPGGAITLATLQAQIAELSGGPPPRATGNSVVAITPQTIAGGSPNLVYGLLNDAALIAAKPVSVVDTFGSVAGQAVIQGFNAVTDIIQVESRQDGSFGALNLFYTGSDTIVFLGGGTTIDLLGVAKTSLSAANFRFV